MKISDNQKEIISFLPHRNMILLRGYIMLGIGVLIALGSIISPDVGMMSFKNAWLPVAAPALSMPA